MTASAKKTIKTTKQKTHIFSLVIIAILAGMAWGCGEEKPDAATQPTQASETNAATPARPTLAQLQQRGQEVFREKCSVCHMVNGQGASGPGPDLSHESAPPPPGVELMEYRAFYSMYLDNPQSYRPDVRMPKVPLTPEEKDAVIEYLMTLQ